jgi:hypothetical protein
MHQQPGAENRGSVAARNGKPDPASALDERADRRAIDPEDQVALPVAGDGAIGDVGGR